MEKYFVKYEGTLISVIRYYEINNRQIYVYTIVRHKPLFIIIKNTLRVMKITTAMQNRDTFGE